MAFELTDFYQSYIPRGDFRGLFNVARSDESDTAGVTRYYAYLNEAGSYVIQKIETSGSLTVKVYSYYAAGKRTASDLSTDWTNRTSLTYVEYSQLFPSG